MADYDIVFDRSALDELLKSEQGPVARDLARRANRAEQHMKSLAPRATGRLADSIETTIERDAEGLVARIGSELDYAKYQELGTLDTEAHPFLRPGLDGIK